MDDNRIMAGNLLALARTIAVDTEVDQLADGGDLRACLSRVDSARPFFVICANDTVLNQVAGTGTLQLRLSNVRTHRLEPGDIVYLPAGTPHRYVPATESVQLKYKAAIPGAEAAAWYCRRCETELFRHTFDTSSLPVDEGYAAGVTAFAAGQPHDCPECGLAERPTP